MKLNEFSFFAGLDITREKQVEVNSTIAESIKTLTIMIYFKRKKDLVGVVMEQPDSNRYLEVLYFRTFHIIEAAFRKELRKKRITPEIGAMLAEISRLKNPRPIELSRSSRRRPQTITAIINRMEMQGLVKKVRNERKTNTYRIRLTGKGLLAYQKVLEIDIFPRIIQTLSEEKREQFRECLEELNDRANKSLK